MELFDQTGTVKQFQQMVAAFEQQQECSSILVFACDANGFAPAEIDPVLKESRLVVFGGIFPQIIYQGSNYDRGTLVVGFEQRPQVLQISGLSDLSVDYEAVIDSQYDPQFGAETMFVWVDGLSSRISALIESLFNIFGLDYNYIGGGAGSLTFEQKPCLFTNDGLLEDCAVLVLAELTSGIGVSHGWESISGPYKVTEAESNVIKALDWEPAFQVYRRAVEASCGMDVTRENFFDLAKGFPFGISRFGAEYIVRDPIVVTEDDALVCVGAVPEDSYIDILHGSTQTLVTAARTARELAENSFAASEPERLILFIDCISRVLYLQEEFGQELAAVYVEGDRMVGALTLGEVANSGRDYLEFYNKTSVVGIFDG